MVGKIIRELREKKGLSLADVSEATSIRTAYLEAIETGNYKKLPPLVYACGFVKNYAEFLGLDGAALVRSFKEELAPLPESGEKEDVAPIVVAPKFEPPPEPVIVKDKDPNLPVREEKRSTLSKVMFAVTALLFLIVGTVFYFFGDGSVGVNLVGNGANAATNNGSPANSDGVELILDFNGRCWAKATADGKVVHEKTAQSGEKMEVTGSNVVVMLGNAGAVEITYNGRNIGKAGKEGEVVEGVFTKEKYELNK